VPRQSTPGHTGSANDREGLRLGFRGSTRPRDASIIRFSHDEAQSELRTSDLERMHRARAWRLSAGTSRAPSGHSRVPRVRSQNFSIFRASDKKHGFPRNPASRTKNVGSCTSPAAAMAHCTPALHATCPCASPRTTPGAAPDTLAAGARYRYVPPGAAVPRVTHCAWNGP
jgi:hypothetical protein